MRTVAEGAGKPLKLTAEQRLRLQNHLQSSHREALDQRFGVEKQRQRCLNSYVGESPADPRWTPYKEAPVVEITIGAMCTDAVIAQAMDLIFQTNPILTVRPTKEDFEKHADALQRLIDIEVGAGTWNFRGCATETIVDNVKLGNMVLYVPFTKTVRRTDIREVTNFGPKMYAMPIEDLIIPANSTKDVQAARFATLRFWMNRKDLNLNARMNNWIVDDMVGADTTNTLQYTRQRAAGLAGTGGQKYEQVAIADTFCYFDLEGDGIESDIEVIWNMSSGALLKVMWNRYDSRPIVLECYQDQAHTWVGLGVMAMSEPFERVATELWNNHVWNAMIANMKIFTGPSQAMDEAVELYPGKFITSDNGKVESMDMGMVNPSSIQAFGMLMAMVRERTGTQLLNAPIRNNSRTPANTMAMMATQANRRFTPPFDNMRTALSTGVMHCLYRLQEQVRGGPNKKLVMDSLVELLGEEDGQLVIELFKQKQPLAHCIDVQLKAASVSVNREADRQQLLQLATQVYPLYWQAIQQLAPIKAHPPFPGADKVADQAVEMLNRLMEKLLRTFEELSEVHHLVIDLDEIEPVMQRLGMEQIPGQMRGLIDGMSNAMPGGPGANGGAPQQ
jgi:hypothetical protein